MGPAKTLASGRLSRRSPVVGADEAHRPTIGREKAEKRSIAIDNKRAVLSWPRRLKSGRRPDISPDGFDTTPPCPRLPDKRTRSGQHETDVNDPFRTLGSLTLAELFAPRPGQHEVFWMGLESCSLL
jgi:hypothetical protein